MCLAEPFIATQLSSTKFQKDGKSDELKNIHLCLTQPFVTGCLPTGTIINPKTFQYDSVINFIKDYFKYMIETVNKFTETTDIDSNMCQKKDFPTFNFTKLSVKNCMEGFSSVLEILFSGAKDFQRERLLISSKRCGSDTGKIQTFPLIFKGCS